MRADSPEKCSCGRRKGQYETRCAVCGYEEAKRADSKNGESKILTRGEYSAAWSRYLSSGSTAYAERERLNEHDDELRELAEEMLDALECATQGDVDHTDKHGLRRRAQQALDVPPVDWSKR